MRAEELKERWRLRWRRWIGVLSAWRSDLRVRVSLARWCLAIYRRELLEHKCESARIEARFWEDEAGELGSSEEDPAELASRTLPETPCVSDGIQGFRWRIWGRLSVASWLLLVPASWAWALATRAGMEILGCGVLGLWFGLAAYSNGVPGASVLLQPAARRRLPFVPEAAALSALTLSAVVGLGGGFIASCLHPEIPASIAFSGIVMGIVFFPLSFGLFFPLAIPLMCCFTVWAVRKRYGRIPRAGYALLSGVSAGGWVLLAAVGPLAQLGG